MQLKAEADKLPRTVSSSAHASAPLHQLIARLILSAQSTRDQASSEAVTGQRKLTDMQLQIHGTRPSSQLLPTTPFLMTCFCMYDLPTALQQENMEDRKSTRLNSSH